MTFHYQTDINLTFSPIPNDGSFESIDFEGDVKPNDFSTSEFPDWM
jgi:hypothetical protein